MTRIFVMRIWGFFAMTYCDDKVSLRRLRNLWRDSIDFVPGLAVYWKLDTWYLDVEMPCDRAHNLLKIRYVMMRIDWLFWWLGWLILDILGHTSYLFWQEGWESQIPCASHIAYRISYVGFQHLLRLLEIYIYKATLVSTSS